MPFELTLKGNDRKQHVAEISLGYTYYRALLYVLDLDKREVVAFRAQRSGTERPYHRH